MPPGCAPGLHRLGRVETGTSDFLPFLGVPEFVSGEEIMLGFTRPQLPSSLQKPGCSPTAVSFTGTILQPASVFVLTLRIEKARFIRSTSASLRPFNSQPRAVVLAASSAS